MISLTDFLPLVRTHVPAVPNPVAEQQLRLAARDFCVRTRCWREILTVTAAANPFSIAPALTTVVAVERAAFGAAKLDPIPFSDLDLWELSGTGLPRNITSKTATEYYALPFTAGDYTFSVYLAPQAGPRFGASGASTFQALQGQVPDFLFDEHADSIAHGAAALLMATSNQAYSDPNMSAFHSGKFNEAINALASEVVRGKQRAPIRNKSQWM